MREKRMQSSSSRDVDMLHGPLLGKIILFALPLGATSILQQLFNAADTAVVGNFASAQAMAAVGSTSALINLIISLFVGLSVGANVVIASLIGKDHTEEIPAAMHTSLAVALLSGCILIFLGQAVAVPLLRVMQTPDDVIGLASQYIRIYFIGMPFIMVYNFGSAILRSRGDSKRPLYALVAAGIINVILNLILVIVFHLHVIGVAAATVISNVVSSGLILRFLSAEEGEFHFSWKQLKIQKTYLLQLLKIGLPAGLQGAVFSLSNTVIQSAINSFGSYAVAGSAAAQNFEYFSYYAVNAFSQASVTFTSQNYAAGEAKRCRSVWRICLLAGAASALFFDGIFYLTRDTVLRIFTSDPEVLSYAVLRFRYILLFHCMIASYEVSGATMRGMGYSLTPSLLMVFGTCVFRVIWAVLLLPLHRSFAFLLMVYPASWVLTGTLVISAYLLARKRAFSSSDMK